MRKISAFLILLLLISFVPARAETDTVTVLDKYVRMVFDCEGKFVFVVGVAGGTPLTCSIDIDFRDREPYVRALDDQECVTYGTFSLDEAFSALFHLISLCEEIQSSLPEGSAFTIDVLLPDGSEYSISPETVSKYYAWIN